MSTRVTRCIPACTVGILVLAVSGCAGLDLMQWGGERMLEADARNPAIEVLAIWQPAEGQWKGVPTRGFAGQIMFFTRRKATPARVDGKVRIFLFDDRGSAEERSKPVHQFDFEGPVWDSHLRSGTLGPSYYVFIPYVRDDSYQAQCSLRVRLESKTGSTIFSEPVSVTLPGPTVNEQPEVASESTSQPSLSDAEKAEQVLAEAFAKLVHKKPERPALAEQPASNGAQLQQLSSDSDTKRPSSDSTSVGIAHLAEPTTIRQVSATVPASVEDPLAARLDRLERMLGKLAESNGSAAVRPDTESEAANEPTGRRFQLTAARGSAVTDRVAPLVNPKQPRVIDFRDHGYAETDDREQSARQARHPLADGPRDRQTASQRRESMAVPQHPLQQMHDEGVFADEDVEWTEVPSDHPLQ